MTTATPPERLSLEAPPGNPAGGEAGGTPIHMARAGTWTDMHGQRIAVTAALLAELAASYDPAVFRAPLVVGHPKTNSPAFGWLASAEATPAGLFGVPVQVDPAFASAVRNGRYPQRSLSFWPAGHPGSPVPGKAYIRHLGVLGATAPAIPGLQGADLAGDVPDGLLTVEFSLPTEPHMADAETIDLAARTSALAEREAALAKAQADLDGRLKILADQEAAAKRAALAAFADTLADEARIRPGDVPALVQVMLDLEPAQPSICFAAPDAPTTPGSGVGWLKAFLGHLPPLVELAEVATQRRAKGAPTPPDDAAIARRARAYADQQAAAGMPISLAAAVDAVTADEDSK